MFRLDTSYIFYRQLHLKEYCPLLLNWHLIFDWLQLCYYFERILCVNENIGLNIHLSLSYFLSLSCLLRSGSSALYSLPWGIGASETSRPCQSTWRCVPAMRERPGQRRFACHTSDKKRSKLRQAVKVPLLPRSSRRGLWCSWCWFDRLFGITNYMWLVACCLILKQRWMHSKLSETWVILKLYRIKNKSGASTHLKCCQ